MTGLTAARRAVAQAVADAVPPGDPLRVLLEAVLSLAAELEAAETRVGQDVVDRLARSAALGANERALALVRAQMRRAHAAVLGLIVLAALAGLAIGWVLGARAV